MSEIAEKIIEEYKKNIQIVDIKIYSIDLWDTIHLTIIDNNKKHFKKVTLNRDTFINFESNDLRDYIQSMLLEYIFNKKRQEIKEAEFNHEIKKFKENYLKEGI